MMYRIRHIAFTTSLLLGTYFAFVQEALPQEKVRQISFVEEKDAPFEIVSLPEASPPMASRSASAGESVMSGVLSASPLGAAVYNIPIATPPGIRNIVPELALAYSSQSSNGIAGYGWHIAGISTISRLGSVSYLDGQTTTPNFSPTDRFALDGQRLVVKSGVYGADGSEYATEIFSNSKIISRGVSSYGSTFGPRYFEVLYPDGSKAFYGLTDDSRSQTDYALTYWENTEGIRINYHYIRLDNMIFVSKITYGSRDAATPPHEVRFTYGNRTRPESVLIGGVRFTNTRLLTKIETLSQGILYRAYTLQYGAANSLGYDRLMSVTETAQGVSKPPTRFSYANTGTNLRKKEAVFEVLTTGNITATNSKTVPLDANGTGMNDFVLYPTIGENAYKQLYLFDGFREENIDNWVFGNTVERFTDVFPTQTLIGADRNVTMQAQGVVTVHDKGTHYLFKTYVKGTLSPLIHQYEKQWELPKYYEEDMCHVRSPKEEVDLIAITRNPPVKVFPGDFNGDGLTDVIGLEMPYSQQYCYRKESNPRDMLIPEGFCECIYFNSGGYRLFWIDLDRRKTDNYTYNANSLLQKYKHDDLIETMDITGDGKTNIVHITNGELFVYGLDTNHRMQLLLRHKSTYIKTNSMRPIAGDFNGDGKIDFLLPTANGSSRFALLTNTGKGYEETLSDFAFPFRENGTASVHNLIPIDLNGDGKTDVMEVEMKRTRVSIIPSRYLHTTTFRVFENTNKTTAPFVYFTLTAELTETAQNNNAFKVPHLIFSTPDKKDRYMDFSVVLDNKITTYHTEKNNREEMLLRSVTHNDIRQDISYASMSAPSGYGHNLPDNTPPVYGSAIGETYPYLSLIAAPCIRLVSKIVRSGGNLTSVARQYAYYNATVHLQGMGFVGFKTVTATNWHEVGHEYGNTVISRTDHSPRLRGAVQTSYLLQNHYYGYMTDAPPAEYLRKTAYTYTDISQGNIFNLQLTSTTDEDRLAGTTSVQDTEYDAYNLPIWQRLRSGNATNVVKTTYQPPSQSPYIVGLPRQQTTESTLDGDTYTSASEWTYRHALVATHKTRGHNTGYDTTTYDYDAYGNPTRTTYTAADGLSRSESYTYDTSGRFMTKHTDYEGNVSSYTYDRFGMLLTETNPYGQTTAYAYDAWQRPTRVTDFLGKSVQTYYTSSATRLLVRSVSDEGMQRSETYNWLGLLLRSDYVDAFGKTILKEYRYDGLGRRLQESEPYFSGGSPTAWTTTTYDAYGRVTKTTLPTGKTLQTTYNGLTTVTDEDGKRYETTNNATGQVVTHTDPGGSIAYTYYGNGTMRTAAYGGTTMRIEQDGYGRKTKLTDPSAGVYTYRYDGLGRLTEETSPKGKTSYTYEGVSERLKNKHIQGDDTNQNIHYAYNTDRLLQNIDMTNADGNNEQYRYTYNTHKQVASVTQTNLHAVFEKRFRYDGFGNVIDEDIAAKAYGKTVTTALHYRYQTGVLTEMQKPSGESLWRMEAANPYGQTSSATKGKTSEISRYTFGHLQSREVRGIGAGRIPSLMYLSYEYEDRTYLMKSRTLSPYTKETFTYDAQERLTGWGESGRMETQTYDAAGRITTNSEAGRYGYTGSSYRLNELIPNAKGEMAFHKANLPQVRYNALKSPVAIHRGKERINYQYDAFGNRAHSYYGGDSSEKEKRRYRKHYSHDGSTEITHDTATGDTQFVFYLGGDAYTAPAIYKETNNRKDYYLLHRDHLGSIILITDDKGATAERRHFDAWGKLTSVTDGNGTALPQMQITDRGYTGHEHLSSVGLIHMNGRLYDPVLHRFLQPDNFVQNPFDTQNFNRYGYVLNNPLMYSDPSGEWAIIDDIIAFVVGGVINITINAIQGNVTSIGAGLGYFVTGGAAGLATIYAGPVAGGAVMGLGNNLTTQISQNGYNSIDWSSALVSTAIGAGTAYLGGQIGTAVSPYTSGLATSLTNSPVLQGAITNGLTNTASGFAINAGFALAEGKNIGEVLSTGGSGALFGAALGTVSGSLSGYKYAKANGLNWKTGTVEGGMTTVGRWMSIAEYEAMKNGSPAAVGAGGKTSVTVGGPDIWISAKPGSVYVEFQVPTNSLVPGGAQGIYSILGPNASKSQLFQLRKLGGQISPPVENISPILKVK